MKIYEGKDGKYVTFERAGGYWTVQLRTGAGEIADKLRCGDTVGVADVYADRIETWRNGNLIGKARNLDDALRQAINAEKRELRRRR